MPNYSVKCEGCGAQSDLRMSFVNYESVKMGVKTLECSSCQGKVSLEFNPGEVAFVMKDGESGGWTSKAGRENAYRARRSKIMAQKTKDHVFKTKLVPNFGGQQTESWREAQEHARATPHVDSEGRAVARDVSTYAPLIKQEQSST
jgi:hypothetical protein